MQYDLSNPKQADAVFWCEQYKKRFPVQGNERTLKQVYDEIQREIDHERNVEEAIYQEMTRNRPDPALHSLMMSKINMKRQGLVWAFNETLERSSRKSIRLSLRALWKAFHINTNWIVPRLWYAVSEGVGNTILWSMPLAFLVFFLWLFIPSIAGYPSQFQPYAKQAMDMVLEAKLRWGPYWYVKGGGGVLGIMFAYHAIRAFLSYQMPSR